MLTTILRRRASMLAVATLTIVLPLSACGSDATTTSNDPGGSVPVASGADATAIWAVLQTLPAEDVRVLYAAFTPEQREELSEVVRAAAGAGAG